MNVVILKGKPHGGFFEKWPALYFYTSYEHESWCVWKPYVSATYSIFFSDIALPEKFLQRNEVEVRPLFHQTCCLKLMKIRNFKNQLLKQCADKMLSKSCVERLANSSHAILMALACLKRRLHRGSGAQKLISWKHLSFWPMHRVRHTQRDFVIKCNHAGYSEKTIQYSLWQLVHFLEIPE